MIPIRIKANHLQHDYSDQGAVLNLPAEKAAVLDALDKARVPYGCGEYRLSSGGRVPGFINLALEDTGHNPSLAEMNHLAERLESLSGYDYGKLEGIRARVTSAEVTRRFRYTASRRASRAGLRPPVCPPALRGGLCLGF